MLYSAGLQSYRASGEPAINANDVTYNRFHAVYEYQDAKKKKWQLFLNHTSNRSLQFDILFFLYFLNSSKIYYPPQYFQEKLYLEADVTSVSLTFLYLQCPAVKQIQTNH